MGWLLAKEVYIVDIAKAEGGRIVSGDVPELLFALVIKSLN